MNIDFKEIKKFLNKVKKIEKFQNKSKHLVFSDDEFYFYAKPMFGTKSTIKQMIKSVEDMMMCNPNFESIYHYPWKGVNDVCIFIVDKEELNLEQIKNMLKK